ncbi:MAG TPA: restriction endonuclease [Verrucomicrobiales bacterium]|nr:restriction endonuclease [Verrucomicrobiales bacterium]
MLNSNSYNPDVLTCLANLSSDEVFTPPKLANEILDQLPEELWSDPDAKFLDPFCKSGVFLREIAKRLLTGLEAKIPDQQARINHIFKNQLYGIAITELTALLCRRSVYCSKTANGEYSVCDQFDDVAGNIRFERVEHTWENGKCIYCGASEENYERGQTLETHAYEFIHTEKPEEIFKMKFDVIIGNPPYQLDTGGSGRQAKPIYQLFVEQAKKLNPRCLTMIIPARWYAGGMGLNKFREGMLNSRQLSRLVDYESASKVFPGVDIAGGICYFLWSRDYDGECQVTSTRDGQSSSLKRPLNEFDIFVRDSKAVSIIRKILEHDDFKNGSARDLVSAIRPFNLPTNYSPREDGTPCWFIQKIGLKYADEGDFEDRNRIIKKWKLLIPKAPIAGQTDFSKPVKFYHKNNAFLAKPGEICTESWIVACAMNTKSEVLSFRSYLFTKIVRFLILQTVTSQDVNKMNYAFVPNMRANDTIYTDETLVKRWGITSAEWDYIDSRILETDSYDA